MDWENIEKFTMEEWEPNSNKVDPILIHLLDDVRITYNKPIVIHCAWANSGHSPKSQHYLGKAVDFHFIDQNFQDQYELMASYDIVGGLGFYPYWTHIGWHLDIRPNRLYWYCDSDGSYNYGREEIESAIKRSMR